MGRLTYGKWPHPASAYISGISAGILVRSPFLWPYVLPASSRSRRSTCCASAAGTSGTRPTSASARALPRARDGGGAQRAVGQRRRADGGDLGARHRHRLARRPAAHVGDLRRCRSCCSRSCAPGVTGTPWVADGRADHRADVSALHLLHGDRPEDDREVDVGAVRGGVPRGRSWRLILRLNEVVYAPFYALFIVGPSALLVEMWLDARRGRMS